MNKFKLPIDPYDYRPLFPDKELELKENAVSCFVGCNGSGKSTAIYFIKNALKNTRQSKKLEVSPYGNIGEALASFSDEKPKETLYYFLDFDKKYEHARTETDYFIEAGLKMSLSNGEGISRKMGQAFELIGSTIKKISGKTLYIFFDDCDAGTSIDIIDEFKDVIDLIQKHCKKYNVTFFIIITSNSYEMCKDYDCIDIRTFEHKKFETYDSFREFVLESRKIKDKQIEELPKGE